MNAEEFATIAWLFGAQYPTAEFQEAWEKMSYVAFHDIITGCGVDDIYDEVRGIFVTLKANLSRILSESLTYIAGKIKTNGRETAVFNPLPWQTRNFSETRSAIGSI